MIASVKFAKVRSSAIIPTKREEDAGFDLYANFEDDYKVISPHETVMIPTGIACACDIDYCFILKERGNTGTKGIAQRCGVIDSGYRNEIFVPITNTTDKPIIIYKKNFAHRGTKMSNGFSGYDFAVYDMISHNSATAYPYEKAITQMIVVPVPSVDVEEYTYDELKAIPSKRGNGCLGSSNK